MNRNFLYRFVESYFRHRWLFLLPILVSAVYAGYYLLTLTPKYNAKGVIYVNSDSLLSTLTAISNNDTDWWVTRAQATTNEINELLQTDAFIRAVILPTDLEANMNEGRDTVAMLIDYVRRSIWVFPQGSQQIEVHALDPKPEISYQLVTSLIDNYIQWKVNAERSDSLTAQEFFAELKSQYGLAMDNARENLKKYLSEHPMPIRGERPFLETLEIEQLNGAVRLAENRYIDALGKEENARLALRQTEAEARKTYVLIDAPVIPAKPDFSWRELGFNVGIFLAVGVFLSFLLVIGNAILDQTVRHPSDIQSQLGLPVLALIPDIRPSRSLFWRRNLAPASTKKLDKAKKDNALEKRLGEINVREAETEADPVL